MATVLTNHRPPGQVGVVNLREMMSTRLVTLAPDDRVLDHLKIFEEHGINHVPVVNENREVAGVVSSRDFENYVNIMKILQSRNEEPVLVRDVMTSPAFTYSENVNVEAAAQAMVDNGIHCVIITDEKKQLAGIVTITDLLKHMANRSRYEGL